MLKKRTMYERFVKLHTHTYTQNYSNWTAVIKFMRWDITDSDKQILIKAVKRFSNKIDSTLELLFDVC